MKRYAVWGKDKSYRYLWVAALISGWDAFLVRMRRAAPQPENKDYQSTLTD